MEQLSFWLLKPLKHWIFTLKRIHNHRLLYFIKFVIRDFVKIIYICVGA